MSILFTQMDRHNIFRDYELLCYNLITNLLINLKYNYLC